MDEKRKLAEKIKPYIREMIRLYLKRRDFLFFAVKYELATSDEKEEIKESQYHLTTVQQGNILNKSLIKLFGIPGFDRELYAYLTSILDNTNSIKKIDRCYIKGHLKREDIESSWWIYDLKRILSPKELVFAIKRYNLDNLGWRSLEEIVKELNNSSPELVYAAMEKEVLSKIFYNRMISKEFYEYLIENCQNPDTFEKIKTRYESCVSHIKDYKEVSGRGIYCNEIFINIKKLEPEEILLIKRTISHPFFKYLLTKMDIFGSTLDILIISLLIGIVDENSLSPLEISYLLSMPLSNVIEIIRSSAKAFRKLCEEEKAKELVSKSVLFLNLSSLKVEIDED